MCATLLSPGHGGIARVARMTTRTLAEAGHPLNLLSLLDKVPVDISGIRAKSANGSKLQYLLRCHAASQVIAASDA